MPEQEKNSTKQASSSRLLLHTVVTLQAQGDDATAAVSESMEKLAELESLTDPNNPNSDIARLNAAAGHGPVRVSPSVFYLLEKSQLLSELSDGAFDCTLLPVSQLYGFGTPSPRVPNEQQLKDALIHTGWKKLRLDKKDMTAELCEEGMAVDLGAAVKGFAADKVKNIMEKHGVSDALCSFGHSTVLAIGRNPSGDAWQIGLQHPRKPGRLSRIIPMTDQSLSVSGDYERFFLHEGRRYHHLLNPVDGLPAQCLQAVAVIIDKDVPDGGLWSDMLSTACFVLGKEKTERLIENLPVKVRYIIME